ncbi:flagellar protein FlaG [Virgibacillus ndiopensis]|uniref:flagellar protein FlaG n=1 Tax=Virgibacillus ndiopensis TaxID=2004408 RepID=UPI000C06E599|nr:flagellar protein FlaG [Virgibacillus ndiopensis]
MRLDNIITGSHPLQTREHNELLTSAKNRSTIEKINEINHEKQGEEITSSKEVKTVVSKLNEFIEPTRTNLKFEFHEKLKEYYVTVVNPLTDEVIKEIPPKKMLDMYAAMAEFMGLLVDEKI